jgi:hypothetical protein
MPWREHSEVSPAAAKPLTAQAFNTHAPRMYVCVDEVGVRYRNTPNLDDHAEDGIARFEIVTAVGTETNSEGIKWILLEGMQGECSLRKYWLPTTNIYGGSELLERLEEPNILGVGMMKEEKAVSAKGNTCTREHYICTSPNSVACCRAPHVHCCAPSWRKGARRSHRTVRCGHCR